MQLTWAVKKRKAFLIFVRKHFWGFFIWCWERIWKKGLPAPQWRFSRSTSRLGGKKKILATDKEALPGFPKVTVPKSWSNNNQPHHGKAWANIMLERKIYTSINIKEKGTLVVANLSDWCNPKYFYNHLKPIDTIILSIYDSKYFKILKYL